jgi:hypothetical protein
MFRSNEEVRMDAKQRQLEHEKSERQLDESTARLRMLDARAKQRKAEGALAEISGLQALGDRIRAQIVVWKNADEASFNELREGVQRGIDALSRGTDAAADRFARLNDATDRWLGAETDQLGAAFEISYAWLGEQKVADQQAAEDARQGLKEAWEVAGQNLQALKAAAPEKKDEARRNLEASLAKFKGKLQEVTARFKGKEAKAEAGKPRAERT